MMRIVRNWIFVYMALIAAGCEIDSCIHGTGDDSQQTILTGYFNTLQVHGILHVVLIQDTACYVEILSGENMLPYVKATNTDSVLSLYNSNSCFYFRDYKKVRMNIHFTRLNRIDLFEVCKLESGTVLDSVSYLTVQGLMAEVDLNLNTQRFGFYNNRTTGGKFTFRGRSDILNLNGYYTASMNTREITARDYLVNNSSLSDMYVNATEKLYVRILNMGNVYFSGSPEITIDSISGSGQLLPWLSE